MDVDENMMQTILVDAREFVRERRTGIGRVLEGLVDALAETDIVRNIMLLVGQDGQISDRLMNRKNINIRKIPNSFLRSEKALASLSKQNFEFLISPYRKLPLFGCYCKAVHMIHDILDITHPVYKNRIKVFFDRMRLNVALRQASLSWYDSSWSLNETREHIGSVGKNPKVRYPGLEKKFQARGQRHDNGILNQYNLRPGYILVVGNGLPHKNLSILLNIANLLPRQIVFVGVSERNQKLWRSRYPNPGAIWITYVTEEGLPAIMRGAFCLAEPSTAEGYGYPPLEAMACGIPAVVSNITVLKETTGGNALFSDPGDARSWIDALTALENQETYRAQVEKGFRWVEPLLGKKGWEKHLTDIEELLRSG